VVLVASIPARCTEAEAEGFRVYHGNPTDERLLLQADLASRRAAIALQRNEGANLIYAQRALAAGVPQMIVALQSGEVAVKPEMVHELGGTVLFGAEVDIDLWVVRVRRELTRVEPRRWEPEEKTRAAVLDVPKEAQALVLPLAVIGERTVPLDDRLRVEPGDVVAWLLFVEREGDARDWLAANGHREIAAAS